MEIRNKIKKEPRCCNCKFLKHRPENSSVIWYCNVKMREVSETGCSMFRLCKYFTFSPRREKEIFEDS